MPTLNFKDVPDAGNFPVIPEGTYRLEVVEIDDTADTRAGEEMWKIRLKVVGGEFKGCMVFDNLVFSPKALGKVKMLCKAVGIDTSGAVNLTPGLILHKQFKASVIVDEYQGQSKNKIPFAGYSVEQDPVSVPFQDAPPPVDESDEPLPF